MYSDITTECPCVSPRMLHTHVRAVSNHESDMMAYKRISADLARGGGRVFLTPGGRKQLRWAFSMAQAEGVCRNERHLRIAYS